MQTNIRIIRDDITTQAVEAIVNAANHSLLGGGGVDGAIHRAAGPDLLVETKKIGGCPTGEARITQGYRLPARWIIHTVGPIWRDGRHQEEKLLACCYQSCFKAARDLKIRTIAFPAISTGAYGFPLERATEIALEETKKFQESDQPLSLVVFTCYNEKSLETYLKTYQRIFPE